MSCERSLLLSPPPLSLSSHTCFSPTLLILGSLSLPALSPGLSPAWMSPAARRLALAFIGHGVFWRGRTYPDAICNSRALYEALSPYTLNVLYKLPRLAAEWSRARSSRRILPATYYVTHHVYLCWFLPSCSLHSGRSSCNARQNDELRKASAEEGRHLTKFGGEIKSLGAECM